MAHANDDLALVLSGGGARAAYQVGFLRCLVRHFPELNIPILTGVSAGAINAAFLANHNGSLTEAVEDLAGMWRRITIEQVFKSGTSPLLKSMLHWGLSLVSGGHPLAPQVRGLVDTAPLHALLSRELATRDGLLAGIDENLRRGSLQALAITGTNYGTGQTMTWVQGRHIDTWERPHRRSVATRLRVEHIMASAALPLFFPAVEVDGSWFGDGGIRLSAPLSPALHLGARRILVISTRYERPLEEADAPTIRGYPSLSQIIGAMMNSVFLDVLDQDVHALEQVNQLLRRCPPDSDADPRPVKHFMLRPSHDIGRLAAQFEPHLPGMFRHLVRGLGTRHSKSPDWLSMLLFDPRYIEHLLVTGEADAEARLEEFAAVLR